CPLFNNSLDCPELSDYQAEEIAHDPTANDPNAVNSDAWQLAIGEAENRCNMRPGRVLIMRILDQAQRAVGQYELQAGYCLQGLNLLTKYVSRMPGQRSIILISPGFLSEKLQPQ